MEAATPEGTARDLDPGLRNAREAAKALPLGKRTPKWKSTFFICHHSETALYIEGFSI